MKKILILGAGVYQVPLIKAAKKMGLYTIVASIPGNYPGFALADKVVYENTVDSDAILKIAREERIDGICTTGTDVAVITVGRVCDALGLHGVSEEGAKIATDKSLMKDVYRKSDVKTAKFEYVDTDADYEYIKAVCERIGYPVIFKAVDSSGSRGIEKVPDEILIDNAVKNVKSVTRKSRFLIEKFLVGEEFGAQAFVQDGKVEFVLPHGDYVFMGDTGVPVGHFAPYDVHGMDAQVIEETEKAIRAMKLDNCAVNADFIYADGEVYVLEIGARGGATCLVELTGIYFGYDYYEKMLRVALGEKTSFSPENAERVPNASKLLYSDRDGRIKSIKNANTPDPDIYEIAFDYGVGDEVHKFRIGPHRIGHVIATGKTLDAAVEKLDEAMARIEIDVE